MNIELVILAGSTDIQLVNLPAPLKLIDLHVISCLSVYTKMKVTKQQFVILLGVMCLIFL